MTATHRITRALGLTLPASLLPLAALAALPQVHFTPLHADGIYRLGQTVGWTVSVPADAPDPRGRFAYTIKRNDLDVVKTGSFSLASGHARLALRFDTPAMLYVTVDYEPTPSALSRAQYLTLNRSLKALLSQDDPALQRLFARYPHYQPLAPQFPFGAYAEHRVATLGAAVAPRRLRPSLLPPRDFKAFWARQLAALRRVPMHAKLTPIPSAQAGVKLFRVRLRSLGSDVRGYLAMPTRTGRFPALIIYQWAGVYPLKRAWATNRAAEGWLVFDVDSHDIAPSRGTGVPQDYPALGEDSPQTSYFLKMYLRDTRALQYIRHNRLWNGQTLVLTGTSMGGQQSLATAGLNPGEETAVIVNEPSGADMNGLAHGRRPGYPFYTTQDPAVLHTAAYFDTVNFAPYITAPTLLAMGFIDTTAPPAGLWTELDEIPAAKEAVPMIDSAHNNITPDKQDAWLSRSEELLAQLAHGDPFVPNQALTRPQTRRVR
ncbi:MAG: acetylxylan esterase [Steroidobacteraceae bacterium]